LAWLGLAWLGLAWLDDAVHRFKRGRMRIVANAHSARPLAAIFVQVNNFKVKFPLMMRISGHTSQKP